MPACQHTIKISPSECMGDSLEKINHNFVNLDRSLCSQPVLTDNVGSEITTFVTEQMKNTVSVLPTTPFVYNTYVDSVDGGAINTSLLLPDGTNIKSTKLPYNNLFASVKPTISFSTVALTNEPPTVTLYWLAPGSNTSTVFDLNSATSETSRGSIWFNDSITALTEEGSTLYVGGKFTQVGGTLCEKFAIIDRTTSTGQLLPNPIPFLGTIGEIRKIIKTTATKGIDTKDILILAGSFQNPGARGRGLLIYSITDDLVYPFYVNGDVNAIFEINQTLYVGGCFDYVNYGTGAASIFSGQRVNSSGFFAVDLSGLLNGLTKGAILDMSSFLGPHTTINDFAYFQGILFLGGEFKVLDDTGNLMCQNACSVDVTGKLLTNWKPIFNGPVFTLHIDNNIGLGDSAYLYLGGLFTKFYTNSLFYLRPRPEDYNQTVFYNAAAIQLTNVSSLLTNPRIVADWKPKFSDKVTRFASHDSNPSSHIYCYTNSTNINDRSCGYLAAVAKASAFNKGELLEDWQSAIQGAPEQINSSLVKNTSNGSLIVGGSFSKVGKHLRYNLAEIGDTDNTVYSSPLSSVSFDFGAHVVTPGTPYVLNMTSNTVQRRTSTCSIENTINATTFSVPKEEFRGVAPGQLIRFFVKRPGNSTSYGSLPSVDDAFKGDVHVVGWKVDFNR